MSSGNAVRKEIMESIGQLPTLGWRVAVIDLIGDLEAAESEVRRLTDGIDQIALEVDEQWLLDRLRALIAKNLDAQPES